MEIPSGFRVLDVGEVVQKTDKVFLDSKFVDCQAAGMFGQLDGQTVLEGSVWIRKVGPRELTSHKVNGCNKGLTVKVLDEPTVTGANHSYEISGFDGSRNPSMNQPGGLPSFEDRLRIAFQNGAIPEVGVNGVTHESILAILIDRLEGFQSGPFACPENAAALSNLRSAQSILILRTERRIARGVEGVHTV